MAVVGGRTGGRAGGRAGRCLNARAFGYVQVLMGYAGYERYTEGTAHGKSQGLHALCPMKLNPNLLHQTGTTAAVRAAVTHHLAYMSDVHSPVSLAR